MLTLIFKAFIYRTVPMYLCELIEQQKTTTNTWFANDVLLLKLPPPSRNCTTLFESYFAYGAPYEWNTLHGFQRSRITRGGTVRRHPTPANRDHHLS